MRKMGSRKLKGGTSDATGCTPATKRFKNYNLIHFGVWALDGQKTGPAACRPIATCGVPVLHPRAAKAEKPESKRHLFRRRLLGAGQPRRLRLQAPRGRRLGNSGGTTFTWPHARGS